MDAVWQEIGISGQHVCETSVAGRYTLICDKGWLQTLAQRRKIPTFPASAQLDRRAHPTGPLDHPWTRVLLQTYRKRHMKVYAAARNTSGDNLGMNAALDEASGISTPLTYSQAVHYVTHTNFKNLWEAAYKRYPGAHVKFCKTPNGGGNGGVGVGGTAAGKSALQHEGQLPYDVVLRELVQRLFNCPLLHSKMDRLAKDEPLPAAVEFNGLLDACHANILPALVAIETTAHICVLFYPPATVTSLHDCITYSPAVLSKSYNKTLFLLYQLLQLSKSLQACGLFLGEVRLHDIIMRDNLWLQLVPRVEANMLYTLEDEHTLTTPSDGGGGGGSGSGVAACEADAYAQSTPINVVEDMLATSSATTNATITTTTTANKNADDVDELYDDDDEDDEADASSSRRTQFDLKFAYDLDQFSLREYCEMWCHGQLSNYDYLTILNNAVGRRLNNPAYHHIMPWVSDLTARNGANWRDLTKSKYRLNKGDTHLDLMYTQLTQQAHTQQTTAGHMHGGIGGGGGSDLPAQQPPQHPVPHHVSDCLSEITYFVYMARRTPQHILRQHVRPIWVPAEYPVSIQRLQEWSPDECIPEFYADPMIFKSVHEDLPDLELPTWATCPEDFVYKHREALESQYVSERLQHWIDLNFGYKLSGKAAIKAKNVCLSAADQHKHLCQRGTVQLFSQAHPPKRFPSPWFGRVAPRLNQLNSARSPKSRHKLHTATATVSGAGGGGGSALDTTRTQPNTETDSPLPGTPTRTLTGAAAGSSPRLSLRQLVSCGPNGDELTASANFYAATNFIELPKDYNPCALLQGLETQQTFFARTFPGQKGSANAQEKIISSDLLFDRDDTPEEHSFTNQLFAVTSTQLQPPPPRKNKSLLAPCTHDLKRRNLKQLLAERRARELQVLGCLIVELFAMQRLRPLLANTAHATSFEQRLHACRTVARQHAAELPKCLRYVVRSLLLQRDDASTYGVSDKGLPPLSAAQLLEPIFANLLIPFPHHYYATYALVRALHGFEMCARQLELQTHFHCAGGGGGQECARYSELDRQRVLFERKIAECKVMACAAHLGQRLLEPMAYEQFHAVELLLPHIGELLSGPADQTAILAAWNLFDPLAQALGVLATQRQLLLPLMRLYDVESYERGGGASVLAETAGGGALARQLHFSSSSSYKSRKSVKLYHHSFLLRLIVRFGLACFLQHFIAALIEAVGGFKEPEHGNGYHYHSGNGVGGGVAAAARRASKNLNLQDAVEQEQDEAVQVEQQTKSLSSGSLLLPPEEEEAEEKPTDVECVFSFDDDVNSEHASSVGGGGSGNAAAIAERKSNDSFDMHAGGGGGGSVGGSSAATAEEAHEYETTPEKLALSEIYYGASKLSNASFDDADKLSLSSQTATVATKLGPKSPTIDIPESALRRSFQLNTIDCDFGSRKSVDSFELAAATSSSASTRKTPPPPPPPSVPAPNASAEPDDDAATDDSLQASTLSRRSEARRVPNDRISEMSAESLIWLSHRLGPVLTSRYIARNLLKLLSLCYVGQENLLPEVDGSGLPATSSTAGGGAEDGADLNYFTVADARVVGDRSAARVLECLMSVTALYGEAVILLQYFPHMSELVMQSTRRLTGSLEGAIIATLQLLKHLVPCLTDATLMERLQDLVLEAVLLPLLRLLGSTRVLMPSGYLGRSVLARKLIDAVYVLCVRIGPDMSKELLCAPLLRPFFLIFDKAYSGMRATSAPWTSGSDTISPPSTATVTADVDEQQPPRKRALEELHDVFGPALAHSVYLAFLRYLGDAIMQRTLANRAFILTMCHDFEQPEYAATVDATLGSRCSGSAAMDCPAPASKSNGSRVNLSAHDTAADAGLANSFGTQVIGNRIEVTTTSATTTASATPTHGDVNATACAPTQRSGQAARGAQPDVMGTSEVLNMVAYKFEHVPNTRHLKGNWLAYWRHEISRAEKDSTLNLQQIRLQSFVGHTNSVRALLALDNENSFISASKDKTVKLWSLRSEGDGSKSSSCQFTYTAHRKAVHSLTFLESLRYVVSCDSGVHIWDPFIGRPLVTLEAGQSFGASGGAPAAGTTTSSATGQRHHNPVTVVKCLPSPSPLIIAGTAESSVRIIDARCMQYVNEWRVAAPGTGPGNAATVRCLAVAPSGNWLAAGLSSGSIVQLDTRTGTVLNMWRPMECDLLQLAAPNDQQLVSSALDHSLAVWHATDSILHYQLKPPPEPAHFLQTIGQQLIFATTGNRIGVYSDLGSSHAPHHTVTKLRSDNFRGVLTSLAVLPLNRSLLAGNESGNIVLLC